MKAKSKNRKSIRHSNVVVDPALAKLDQKVLAPKKLEQAAQAAKRIVFSEIENLIAGSKQI
jgi:hypothetical protein